MIDLVRGAGSSTMIAEAITKNDWVRGAGSSTLIGEAIMIIDLVRGAGSSTMIDQAMMKTDRVRGAGSSTLIGMTLVLGASSMSPEISSLCPDPCDGVGTAIRWDILPVIASTHVRCLQWMSWKETNPRSSM